MPSSVVMYRSLVCIPCPFFNCGGALPPPPATARSRSPRYLRRLESKTQKPRQSAALEKRKAAASAASRINGDESQYRHATGRRQSPSLDLPLVDVPEDSGVG